MMNFGGIQQTSFRDYPGKISTVLFTVGCNFKCPYCHNGHLVKGSSEERYSSEEMLSYLKSRQHLIDAVVISGGEPTLHGENLIGFMETVKGMGFLVKLDTNGTNPSLLHRLIEDKLVDYVAMDIKAPVSSYERVTGAPLEMAHINKSIHLLRAAGISHEFRTTVAKELLSKEDILRLLEEMSPLTSPFYLQNFRDVDTVLDGKGKFSPVDFLEDIQQKYPKVMVR